MIGAIASLAVVGLAVLLVVLAIRDRERGLGERGTASAIVRAGMLEAQNLLEPARKIEIVREAERFDEERVAESGSGEPPEAGG